MKITAPMTAVPIAERWVSLPVALWNLEYIQVQAPTVRKIVTSNADIPLR